MKNANVGEKVEEAVATARKSSKEVAREKGRQAMLIEMLEHRFGPLSRDVLERVQSASSESLSVFFRRGLSATRLEEFEMDR